MTFKKINENEQNNIHDRSCIILVNFNNKEVAAIKTVSSFAGIKDRIVLTSKNGVDIFFDKLDEMGLDCRALANIKVCSIGAATSKAIIRRGIKPDIQPEKAVGESLYDELKDIVSKEDKILIPRAKNAREFLVKKLNEISNVTEVVTYESVMDDSKKEEAISALEEGNLDYITFASSSTVTNFINLIGEENKESELMKIFKEYNVEKVIYGHLHGPSNVKAIEGVINGIEYIMTSCDFIDFDPIKVLD